MHTRACPPYAARKLFSTLASQEQPGGAASHARGNAVTPTGQASGPSRKASTPMPSPNTVQILEMQVRTVWPVLYKQMVLSLYGCCSLWTKIGASVSGESYPCGATSYELFGLELPMLAGLLHKPLAYASAAPKPNPSCLKFTPPHFMFHPTPHLPRMYTCNNACSAANLTPTPALPFQMQMMVSKLAEAEGKQAALEQENEGLRDQIATIQFQGSMPSEVGAQANANCP